MPTLIVKNYRCFPDSSPVRIDITSGITAFLGANNSGKTSLLRLFMELRPYLWWTTAKRGVIPSPLFPNNEPAPRQLSDLSHDLNDRQIVVTIEADDITMEIELTKNHRSKIELTVQGNTKQLSDGEGVQNHEEAERLLHAHPQLRLVKDIVESLYVPAFRTPFSTDSQMKLASVPLGHAFIQEWDKRKRGTDKAGNRLVHRVTADVAHLMGLNSLSIDATDDRNGMTLLINDSPYQLHEVGSGLSHCLMTLFYAAVARPTYICIDEPETGLHPCLQIDFINALNSYSTRGLWMATHNVGLARSVATDIYVARRFQKHSELAKWEDTPRLSAVLGELSFGSYAALGGASILLVEGPNEVRCYQQWLRAFSMDHNVIIIPLGGQQMINGTRDAELAELTRISERVFAVIDRDGTQGSDKVPQQRIDFQRSCKNLGIECRILDRRATENYFTSRAIKEYDNRFDAIGPFDVPPDNWWGKKNNWRVARLTTADEIKDTDLGAFLLSLRA
jgi:hypothetical protein